MNKTNERRTLKRIDKPGVMVRYKIPKGINVFRSFASAGDALNVSKSGISFRIDETVAYGTPVQIQASFSDGKQLDLKGHIRWQKSDDGTQKQVIGVQFIAFGQQSNYNSHNALDYLRSMKDQAIALSDDDSRHSAR